MEHLAARGEIHYYLYHVANNTVNTYVTSSPTAHFIEIASITQLLLGLLRQDILLLRRWPLSRTATLSLFPTNVYRQHLSHLASLLGIRLHTQHHGFSIIVRPGYAQFALVKIYSTSL